MSDDAYTNAVARRNLEFATAAARRLGVAADPRWAEVAAKLHMPIDSASGFFRTYEGAPDSYARLGHPAASLSARGRR